MYKLLIVDDDSIMRRGMEANINWAENGIQVVGSAENGKECLEKIKTCLPDVVLTDIWMPIVDGLQLAEVIQKLYPQIKVVVLTAYDDFQFAKRALELKVCTYVMKYEGNEKILKAVCSACADSDSQRDNSELLAKSRYLLINQLLSNMLTRPATPEEVAAQTQKLGIGCKGPWFCVALLDFRADGDGAAPERPDRCTVAVKLEELYRQWNALPEDTFFLVHSFPYRNYLAAIFDMGGTGGSTLGRIHEYLGEHNEALSKKMCMRVTAGVGNIYEGYAGIPRSYAEAVQALEMKDFMGVGRSNVVFMDAAAGRSQPTRRLIRQIVQYIEDNYCREDLSLSLISGWVHVSETYISSLFKKYQSVNISEYITALRMKKAEELLRYTALHTYEISERIGYSNSQYFSVIFKKYAGLSPTEYRKKHVKIG